MILPALSFRLRLRLRLRLRPRLNTNASPVQRPGLNQTTANLCPFSGLKPTTQSLNPTHRFYSNSTTNTNIKQLPLISVRNVATLSTVILSGSLASLYFYSNSQYEDKEDGQIYCESAIQAPTSQRFETIGDEKLPVLDTTSTSNGKPKLVVLGTGVRTPFLFSILKALLCLVGRYFSLERLDSRAVGCGCY
jgi:hypothetical protein